MGVRDLVDAIVSGDSLGIQQSFDQEMTSRIADRMNDMRVDVAQSMFRDTQGIQEQMDSMKPVKHGGRTIGHTWEDGDEIHGEHKRTGASWSMPKSAGRSHEEMAEMIKDHHQEMSHK